MNKVINTTIWRKAAIKGCAATITVEMAGDRKSSIGVTCS